MSKLDQLLSQIEELEKTRSPKANIISDYVKTPDQRSKVVSTMENLQKIHSPCLPDSITFSDLESYYRTQFVFTKKMAELEPQYQVVIPDEAAYDKQREELAAVLVKQFRKVL